MVQRWVLSVVITFLALCSSLAFVGCAKTASDTRSYGDAETPLGPEDCPPEEPSERCPCEPGASAPCYPHPATRMQVGECRPGRRYCQSNGLFGPCEGAIVPQEEVCNGKDDSCNGQIDDGLEDCLWCPDCNEVAFGDADASEGDQVHPFSSGTMGTGTQSDDNGNLTLESKSYSLDFVWIANSDEGTVSKIEAATGREVARYVSALPGEGRPDPTERCDPNAHKGNCPSRTAVDVRGDVWVANRAFGGQGSVTKIQATSEACVARNDNGEVRTSWDANGDGRIDIHSELEFPGVNDDCILFTANVGVIGSIPRALAVDPFGPDPDRGSVFVGAFNEERLYRLDGLSGMLVSTVDLPIQPYGAVMGREGKLWVNAWGGEAIVSVNPAHAEVADIVPIMSSYGCRGGYGIAMDEKGRVWLGGWQCEAAFRYDPAENRWMTVRLQGRGWTRGIAVDGRGYVWTAHSHDLRDPTQKLANLTAFRAEDGGDRKDYSVEGQEETIGVGVDFEGKIWAVHRSSDTASYMDPATDSQFHTLQVGSGPYTYSDFTGYGLRTFTSPLGRWQGIVDNPCHHGLPDWIGLRWDADVPEGANLEMWAYVAQHSSELMGATGFGPFASSPADLASAGVYRGNVLMVEAALSSRDRSSSPVVKSITVTYACPTSG